MSEVFCPKCGRECKERRVRSGRSAGRTFMGCVAYFPKSERNPDGHEPGEPKCDGAVWNNFKKEVIVKQAPPKIVGSPQQKAIWHEMEFGTEHMIIKALAGTGKTTTMVVGASRLKGSVLAMAFNNKIARELTAKMPENCVTSTFHALGWSALRNVFGRRLSPNKHKTVNLADKYVKEDWEDGKKIHIKTCVKRLVSLCKNRLMEPNEENLTALCERYRIDCDENALEVFEITEKVFRDGLKSTDDFDFDDQIFMPIVLNLPLGKFDNVIVDESQDLNPARIEMVFRVAGKNGRILIVGDENQAIYGFTGSDDVAMQTMYDRLAAA